MALITSMVNEGRFLEIMRRELNDAMTQAAEPLVQEALTKIEINMRKELASSLIARIDHMVSMERFGDDLRITVAGPPKNV
jgi:2-keto-3-deoxy-6-phosphogluconate aldolase